MRAECRRKRTAGNVTCARSPVTRLRPAVWRFCACDATRRRLDVALTPGRSSNADAARLVQTTFLAHDTLEPRHDHPHAARRAHSGPTVKHDGSAEHIVRSSILKLLREGECRRNDSSAQRAEAAALGGTLNENDIWALQPKAPGSPTRFKA